MIIVFPGIIYYTWVCTYAITPTCSHVQVCMYVCMHVCVCTGTCMWSHTYVQSHSMCSHIHMCEIHITQVLTTDFTYWCIQYIFTNERSCFKKDIVYITVKWCITVQYTISNNIRVIEILKENVVSEWVSEWVSEYMLQ